MIAAGFAGARRQGRRREAAPSSRSVPSSAPARSASALPPVTVRLPPVAVGIAVSLLAVSGDRDRGAGAERRRSRGRAAPARARCRPSRAARRPSSTRARRRPAGSWRGGCRTRGSTPDPAAPSRCSAGSGPVRASLIRAFAGASAHRAAAGGAEAGAPQQRRAALAAGGLRDARARCAVPRSTSSSWIRASSPISSAQRSSSRSSRKRSRRYISSESPPRSRSFCSRSRRGRGARAAARSPAVRDGGEGRAGVSAQQSWEAHHGADVLELDHDEALLRELAHGVGRPFARVAGVLHARRTASGRRGRSAPR